MNSQQASEAQENFKKGTTAYCGKNYDKAEKLLKKSINVIPTCEAWLNLGLVYVAISRYDEALKAFNSSIQCNSKYAEAWLNLGSTYKAIGLFNEALASFQSAIRCNPQYAEAWNNLGLVFHMQNNETMADGFFKKALEINPEYMDANWNFSLSLLKRACDGDYSLFPEGWMRFEYRFFKTGAVTLSARDKGTRWIGQEGSDKTLLVVFEQGIGDNIMFARYLPYLTSRFKTVYVQCISEMRPIFSGLNLVDDISGIEYDYWVPVCSLAAHFDFIPNEKYIVHNETRNEGDIGIVWQGSAAHHNDANRSVDKKLFHRFSKYGSLVSLQYGDNQSIKSFDDTMSIINGCKLLICVDTSIAHLAAAMGKTVFILVPEIDTDYRWGAVSKKSIWYPTAELIRGLDFDECERRVAEYAHQA